MINIYALVILKYLTIAHANYNFNNIHHKLNEL